MAAIVWSDVEALSSQFALVHPTFQTDILNYVNNALDVSVWGGEEAFDLRLARIYLAAHLGSMPIIASGQATGAVVSETVGGLQRTYANATTGQAIHTSSYGSAYQFLLDSLGLIMLVI